MDGGRESSDVMIVGGGPAGLAAAIAARRRGLSVMVADGALPPIDKACGEGVMPNGVAALRELGVSIGANDGVPFHGIRFIENGLAAQARFPAGYGLGIRRTTLHRILVEAAAAAGVEMRWGTPVRRVDGHGMTIGGRAIRAHWLIGADGHNSPTRQAAGLRAASAAPRVGFRQHYRARPWTDMVEVYWHHGCQAVATPVGPDDMCVSFLGIEPREAGAAPLDRFPDLARRLAGAEATSSTRGGVCGTVRVRSVARGNIALIGDASGSVDALTGEGTSLAFREALVLADALACDDLSRYRAAQRRICRMPSLMGRLLAAAGDRRWLRQRMLSTMAAKPSLFERLLAIHVGAIAPTSIGFGTIAQFGWHFLISPPADQET
jgi:flavin-dependent dehydrogenase